MFDIISNPCIVFKKYEIFVEVISDNPWKRWIVKAADITFTGHRKKSLLLVRVYLLEYRMFDIITCTYK